MKTNPQNKFSSFGFNFLKISIVYGNTIEIVLDFIKIGKSHSQHEIVQRTELLNIKQASQWATEHIGKTVTPSNITYLINYGRILKVGSNSTTFIPKQELID